MMLGTCQCECYLIQIHALLLLPYILFITQKMCSAVIFLTTHLFRKIHSHNHCIKYSERNISYRLSILHILHTYYFGIPFLKLSTLFFFVTRVTRNFNLTYLFIGVVKILGIYLVRQTTDETYMWLIFKVGKYNSSIIQYFPKKFMGTRASTKFLVL